MVNENPWHLDKRVPLALIVTILAQSIAAVWWAATVSSAVWNNTTRIDRLDAQVEMIRNTSQEQAVQLGRIEESVRGMRDDINRLIATLERAAR